MTKFTLILLGFIILSCKKETKYEGSTSITKPIVVLDINSWKKEILNIDSMKIDGQFPLLFNKEEYIRKFGKPDQRKIMNPQTGYFSYLKNNINSNAYQLIYGETILDGYQEQIVINTIDFNSTDIEIIHPSITLKKGTPAMEVCRLFPESCKLVIVNGNRWSGHVELFVSNRNSDPRRWFLVFKSEELIKIILYTFPYYSHK